MFGFQRHVLRPEGVDPDKVCYVKTLGKYIHPIFCERIAPIGGRDTDHHVCKW